MAERMPISVLCVDDNELVTEALQIRLRRAGGFQIAGVLDRADDLASEVLRLRPDVVLLDMDMPGTDPVDALARLHSVCPEVRVLVLSGHTRQDLVDRALEAGAWGYLGKLEPWERIEWAIREVVQGRVVLTPAPPAEWLLGGVVSAGHPGA